MSTQHIENEKEIILKIVSGESNLYEQLVNKYKNQVLAVTTRITGDQNEAEEAAQDAFIKAYQNLPKFNFQAKFSTWLYRIAFNTAISYQRKKKIEKTSFEEVSYSIKSGDRSDVELMKKDQKKYIKNALSKLQEIDQTVLTLYYLNEHSMEEVCKATGMKMSAVKVRLFRARKKLADELMSILPDESQLLIS